jgi:hypothetical protein
MNEGFLKYVLQFYGPGGLYDIKMTPDEADRGARIVKMLAREFVGDSVDREKVRDIVRVIRGEKLTRLEI